MNEIRFKQAGFSLLETMIASALCLVLTGIFMVVYLTVKNSFNLQKNVSDIQQKGRFLIYFFYRTLSRAGIDDCSHNSVYPSNIQVYGENGESSDQITIYQCLSINGVDVFGAVNYFLENNRLYFKPKPGFHPKRLLVDGIEKMKIEYGIHCKNEGEICRYLPAIAVEDWTKVRSVSMELHLTSDSLKKTWHLYMALPRRDRS